MFYIKKNSAKSSVQKRRDWRRHDTDALALILLREAIKSSPILGNHRILYFSFYFPALGEKSDIRCSEQRAAHGASYSYRVTHTNLDFE